MDKIKAVISDLDGTLLDTRHLIRHGQYEAAKTYLTKHGIPAAEIPTFEEYEPHLIATLGGPARETLERTIRLLYQASPHHLESINFDELHDLLNPIQDTIAPEFVKAYAGLSDLLTYLGNHQISFAIFSSGTPHHIVRNFGIALPEVGCIDLYQQKNLSEYEKLSQFTAQLEQHFQLPKVAIITVDDVSASKPDPASLKLALDKVDVQPADALVLGDHRVDMQSGVNAGVPTRIGITHGFDDAVQLKAAGATAIIDKLLELSDYL
jgi:phosphoglycolate phosphatase-like HAD superfamily hydrolase